MKHGIYVCIQLHLSFEMGDRARPWRIPCVEPDEVLHALAVESPANCISGMAIALIAWVITIAKLWLSQVAEYLDARSWGLLECVWQDAFVVTEPKYSNEFQ